MSSVSVLVVGGGVAGLAAAARVSDRGVDVLVLESSDRVGGKLRSHTVGGLLLDAGAESLLARHPEAISLVARAGRSDDLVHPATSGAGLWTDDVRPLPRDQLMGIPTDLDAPDLERLLGAAAVDRLRCEPELLECDLDTTVGALVRAQLGDRVVDLLVEPLLGGVYAGHADALSVDMAIPGLLTAATRTRSLVRAAAELRERSTARAAATGSKHAFASVVGGLGGLATSLVSHCSLHVRCDAGVTQVQRRRSGWRARTSDGEVIDADAVVLAVPAHVATGLLLADAPEVSALATRLGYASVALVTTVFERGALVLPAGTGFLVPPVTGRLVKAATFVSRKWQWVHEAAPDREVLRFSVGRSGDARGLGMADAQLTASVVAEVGDLLQVATPPVASAVCRWPRSLPQYEVGHRQRVASVRQRLPRGLALAGASWDGVGIAACVASGEAAADAVLPGLGAAAPAAEGR